MHSSFSGYPNGKSGTKLPDVVAYTDGNARHVENALYNAGNSRYVRAVLRTDVANGTKKFPEVRLREIFHFDKVYCYSSIESNSTLKISVE